MTLDYILFGNGHGLGAPYFDQNFYWLSGRFYTWIGGFGAQLQSIEWFSPPAGTRRSLIGMEFVIFQAHRRWLKVRCSWAAINVNTIEEISSIKKKLEKN